MAKAKDFSGEGFNQDLIIDNELQFAAAEIYATYGHRVRVNRKSLHKFGRNQNVGTTEVDITTNSGTEAHTFANTIDSISSSDSADTDIAVYIEGMTISNGVFTFVSQIVNTDASDGQTRAAIPVPLAECTRMRAVTAGDVYAYVNTSLTAGKPTDTTKIHNTLVSGDNTSLKAGTAIAGGNYYLMRDVWATMGRTSGGTAGVDVRLKLAQVGNAALGNTFYTAEVRAVSFNNSLQRRFSPLLIVPPNSLITMTAQASSGTQDVKAGFSGFFADIVE